VASNRAPTRAVINVFHDEQMYAFVVAATTRVDELLARFAVEFQERQGGASNEMPSQVSIALVVDVSSSGVL
jgi:hypothetical protein